MNRHLFILSLPCILSLLPNTSFGAVRIGNNSRSYADAYGQVAMMQQQAAYVEQTSNDLPVRVADKNLADRILARDSNVKITMDDLDACARIYPTGEFAWDKPTAGVKAGSSATCVAVVEMRVLDGANDIIVARANIAAGDAVKCNISEFPESSYTIDAGNVIFPADKAPTMDDVVKVMNEEQKKNAGLKIAAGAIVGGLLGNAAGKNDVGDSGLMGTGRDKMQGTAVGALSGGALMAGSAYSGKVGGDMIMSAGVNATAGAVVGNMLAGGESVLRIERCDGNKSCLWGVLEKGDPLDKEKEFGFYDIGTGDTLICTGKSGNDYNTCKRHRLVGISFNQYKSIDAGVIDQNFQQIRNGKDKYSYAEPSINNGNQDKMVSDATGTWTPIATGSKPNQRINAMVVDFDDKMFGVKMQDWYKWRNSNQSAEVVARNNLGEPSKIPGTWNINDFYPLTIDASDGGIIDLSNRARTKSTMIGAGAGAGLGAFTAYHGATDEITQRWVAAVQEYEDSLMKTYCITGERFISSYNDITVIPNMSVIE